MEKQVGGIKFYLNLEVNLGVRIKNPLREDKNPSASFWVSPSNTLYLVDFARATKLDIVDVVMKKFGLSKSAAILKIQQDLDKFDTVEVKTEAPATFDVVRDVMDYSYWDSYKIPREVVDRYTFKARTVYRNETYWGRSTAANPIYVYAFVSGRYKLYRPKSPESSRKWAGNSTAEDIGGLAQLPKKGNLVVITSSVKDVMVLRQHGFPAICFNGEGYGCDPDSLSYIPVKNVVRALKKRFTNVVLLLDSDEAGRTNAAKFSLSHKVPYTYTNKNCKDPSDFQKKFGQKATFRMLKRRFAKSFIQCSK